MTLIKKIILVAIILFAVGCKNEVESRRIAHAGGGYKGNTYTNSFEALNENYHKGFRIFEIDLNWTSDNQLVCIHDWEETFVKSFGFKMKKVPSLEEFTALVSQKAPYHICTLKELGDWIKDNRAATIVTDIKDHNFEGLELISKSVDGFETRIIPQIYQPENYRKTQQLGFKNIIWTLYRYAGNNDTVISLVPDMDGLYAVTMPLGRVSEGLGIRLKEMQTFTYTHTINNVSDLALSKKAGIDDVYTDFLPPN